MSKSHKNPARNFEMTVPQFLDEFDQEKKYFPIRKQQYANEILLKATKLSKYPKFSSVFTFN